MPSLAPCSTSLLLSALLAACAAQDGRDSDLDGECIGAKCDGHEQGTDPCDGSLPICERIESCVGWSANAQPDWRFDYYADGNGYQTCLAYQSDDASQRPPGFDADRQRQLLSTMALHPDELWSEGVTACAMLEQARQLCDDGYATSSIIVAIDEDTQEILEEATITRDSMCSSRAEVGCERYVPEATDFVAGTAAHDSFAAGVTELDEAGASYCVRQSAADCTEDACGYPLAIPSTQVSWECSAEDATRLSEYVANELGGRMIGHRDWSVGAAGSNTCRTTKALVDCVLPNLGEIQSTSCEVINEVGDSFSAFDYCFDIQQVTGGGGAHADGRAIDLNVATNNGNLAQCNLKLRPGDTDFDYTCTNRERPTTTDLPPRFVSLMEGCGFTWGGRWGGPGGDSQAESRYLGCDPMHFELP